MVSTPHRQTIYLTFLTGLSLAMACNTGKASEFEFEGEIEGEWRHFFNEAQSSTSHDDFTSASALLELGIYSDDGTHALIAKPFARADSHDENRSHADLREAKYRFVEDDFELTLGLDKIFWGVTEFAHIVDIINQTDNVESTDGEQKLGQAMITGSYVTDYGTFSAFFMPTFRPRNFSSTDGRPFPGLTIDNDNETYEASRGEDAGDIAFRYAHSWSVIDLGLAYFDGTSRDPIISLANMQNGKVIPHYPLREQISIDAQATLGPWLLKLEALHQDESNETSERVVAGFEYSFYGIFASSTDLGIVMEYLWDERGDEAPHPFADDLGLGLRWTANDIQSTTLLAGAIIDLEYESLAISLEAERRLNNSLKLSLEARIQDQIDPQERLLYAVRDEDFARLRLTYYF
jgi:hypothetical protein